MISKQVFTDKLREIATTLSGRVSTDDGQWAVKGFIDTYRHIYTISSDTKVISKVLEIHIFPHLFEFAKSNGLKLVLADHQNYYPDVTFISEENPGILYTLDIKTSYRNPRKEWLCSGFTLGSHGNYFVDRTSKKNIQFPYDKYSGHFCLGILYDRVPSVLRRESKPYLLEDLHSIASVISNIQFFVAEKWKIASDKRGSGNTANIGSIRKIEDLISERGMFTKLGEGWFDDYWMNYDKIVITEEGGGTKRINSLHEFVEYRGGDVSLIVPMDNSK